MSNPSCVGGHFYDTRQRDDVTDGRERVAGRMLRGAPTVAEGEVVEIDAIADPERVRRIAAAVLGDE